VNAARKPYAPACDQNAAPILAAIAPRLAEARSLLEIGSGTGQHAVRFAAALPELRWQTSDLPEALSGIRLWLDEAALANTPAPLVLDVTGPWPEGPLDAVFTANSFHIMAWVQVEQAIAGAARVLGAGGQLMVYGPVHYGGRATSPSNAEFDAWLRAHDPLSGVRNFEDLDRCARAAGLALDEDLAMPANNRILIWRRADG
jgi:cyclopropane fatty-acyl-phospholipid synthase-like methyltransferase